MTNDKNATSAEVMADDDLDGVQGGMSGLDFAKQSSAPSTHDASSIDWTAALNDTRGSTVTTTSGGSPSDADKAAAALALFQLNSNLAKLRS